MRRVIGEIAVHPGLPLQQAERRALLGANSRQPTKPSNARRSNRSSGFPRAKFGSGYSLPAMGTAGTARTRSVIRVAGPMEASGFQKIFTGQFA